MRKKWYRLNFSECECKFATLRVPDEIQKMSGGEWKCLEPQGTSFSHHRVECCLHKTAEAVDVGRALECKILSEKLKSEARAVENYCVRWESREDSRKTR